MSTESTRATSFLSRPSDDAHPHVAGAGTAPRRRGRPLEMSREQLLQRIQELASRDSGLFRIHREQSGLYARARRLFGSWSAAVAAAGVDYSSLLGAARRRAVQTRRQNARRQAIRRT